MPLSMKVQPIDCGSTEERERELPPPVVMAVAKPVVKSRLKRLFRISGAEKDFPAAAQNDAAAFEPSSVCLAKMVQNFIEESGEREEREKVKCGRNRCNCFNGNGSDGSDGESEGVSAADVCDFLKSLVVCASMNERNVLADTAKIVAEKSKACKRKVELRKLVTDGLVSLGYDAATCKSKWDKSPSFPAGEYEYVDVIVGGERLIIDIDFRSEFVMARSTKTYKSILQVLPHIFVGKSQRLSKIICILSEAAKQSLKKKGMHIPPWRKVDYVQAKWLSPPTRLVSAPAITTPPPSPLSPPVVESSPDGPAFSLLESQLTDEPELSKSSPRFEPVFEMSESSGEEDAKEKKKHKDQKPVDVELDPSEGSKVGVKIVTGLASIMEDRSQEHKF